jgi:hypothetical protein
MADADGGRAPTFTDEKQSRKDELGGIGGYVADTSNTRIHERRGFDAVGEGVQQLCGNVSDGIPGSGQKEAFILADTNSAQREGNQLAERIRSEYSYTCSAGWWSVEPDLGRVADGVSNRIHRLKGLGNAQVPLQAAVAWKLLGGE